MIDDCEIIVTDESVFAPQPADFVLSKEIADLLDKHYPGHAWQ
jgi:hypothetical protein